MPAERPNFYLLLDLDPSVEDWPTIEGRLVEKQRAWSHDLSMGSPKARRRAESALALVPEIKAVLADPGPRRIEAEQARRGLQKARLEQIRELDEAIALLQASGEPASETQVAALSQRFSRLLSAAEIRRRLHSAGIAIRPPGQPPPRQARERIDEVTAGELRQNLDHLGLADLYAFLGLGPQSSLQALSDRAEEVYRDNHRSGRTDADASARNVLAGVARTLFRSDAEKAKYDNYLAVAALDALRPNIELAGAGGYLNAGQRDALLKLARQRNVGPEEALAYLEDYAAARRWHIEKDGSELKAAAQLQLCGFCFALASPGAASCPECGRPLRLDCPRCGMANATANAACEGCGRHVGDAPLVTELLARGRQLVVDGDLAAAMRCFDQALIYWPDWQPAIEAKRACDERRGHRETELAAIEDLVRRRQLAAARTALERSLRTFGAAGLDDLRRRIDGGLRLAEGAFQQGERRHLSGDGEAALESYDEALAACADFEPARLGLAACPPPPPADLVVVPRPGGLRLTWSAAPSRRALLYRVVRRAGGSPRDAEDGERLAEVATTSCDDSSVPVGVPWFYAVFSLRRGVVSAAPAASGPHLVTAEVEDLELIAGDRTVTLTWRPPARCAHVEVVRRHGGVPSGPTDGTALVATATGARDAELSNGETYGYRVVALYPDPLRTGGWVRTAGRTAMVRPSAPPEPVLDLRAERRGRVVTLRWTPVAGAAVEIRMAPALDEPVSGLLLPAAGADRFGSLVAGAASGEAQVTTTHLARIFFVPLSVRGATAVAGKAITVVTLDPVAGLEVRRAGRGLLLTWDWPEGCDDALVAWSHERYPEDPHDRLGSRRTVTRREYERGGGWLMRLGEAYPLYFAVFAKVPGTDVFTLPARALASAGQGIAISYQVVVKRALFSRAVADAWVELRSSNGDPVLRDVLMVGKGPAVPLSPQDGELLAEMPEVALAGGRAQMPIPARHWRGRPYVRLFFKDAAAAHDIRLLPAAKERLRVA